MFYLTIGILTRIITFRTYYDLQTTIGAVLRTPPELLRALYPLDVPLFLYPELYHHI